MKPPGSSFHRCYRGAFPCPVIPQKKNLWNLVAFLVFACTVFYVNNNVGQIDGVTKMRKIPVDTTGLEIVAAVDQSRDAAEFNEDRDAPVVIKVDADGNPLVRLALIISDGSTATPLTVNVPKGKAPEKLRPLAPVTVEGLTIAPYVQNNRVGLSGTATNVRLVNDGKPAVSTK